jgi:uncharacterized membrane protein YcfT
VLERSIVSGGDPPTSERVAWVDAARGASVAAVVLFHVSLWWYLPLEAELWDPAARVWGTVNSYLGSVRMPLLLAVSGLVAAGAVRAGLRDPRTVTRAVANGYLYVVWAAVYAVFYALVPGPLPHRVDGVDGALRQLAVPDTPLWYLYALALYSVGLAALRRAPAWSVLTGLAVVSVAARALLDGPGMWPRILELAVFFALGVYARPVLLRFAAGVTVTRTAACAALALAATLAGRVVSGEVGDGVLFLVRGAAFVAVTVAGVCLAIRWRPVRRTAAALGRRTLPVYALHVPLVALLVTVTRGSGARSWSDLLANPATSAVLPGLATVAIVLASLAVGAWLARGPLDVLLRTPAGLTRLAGRLAVAGTPGSADRSAVIGSGARDGATGAPAGGRSGRPGPKG